MGRPKSKHPRARTTSLRLTDSEHDDMARAAASAGFKTVSDYLRDLHERNLKAETTGEPKAKPDTAAQFPAGLVHPFHTTQYGTIYKGDSRGLLFGIAAEQSVDLIMTSPPFGLVRKKDYGNEDAHEYCEWFRPFAEGFHRVLKDSGSLVIDIGGAWKPGTPTRSLYHFELLIMLCKEYGFHLAQEHYWWNPSKLPTPAEWVNVRRVRVKDAVNCIWWLSKTPFPKASNKRVLQPYSESMRSLLRNGYVSKLRPSGHDISDNFMKDNGGSVPPNILAVANTESNGRYQDFCRINNIAIHPARFPAALPEYFIRMLTDPGDVVLDPFAGSCVTGAVAERLKRRWTCSELSDEYLQGALARFTPDVQALPSEGKKVVYEIPAPCSHPTTDQLAPLAPDGGAARPPALRRANAQASGPKAEAVPA